MADIELVIKISEKTLKDIKMLSDYGYNSLFNGLVEAISNGTPLPKGHGDLIYRDDLLVDSYCIVDLSGNEVNIVDVMTVKMADAIIEADKESEDKE